MNLNQINALQRIKNIHNKTKIIVALLKLFKYLLKKY